MAAIETGRICYLLRGRNAGKKVVIVSGEEKGKVKVQGKALKQQPCSIRHLFPLPAKVSLPKNPSEQDILKAMESLK